MITSPKGIASTTLATDLGITQKTAWFVLHRLRHAGRTDSFNALLKGQVEVDETYIGDLENDKYQIKRASAGRGGVGKTVVMGIIDDTKASTLQGIVRENVERGAGVYTDEHAGCRGLGNITASKCGATNVALVRHNQRLTNHGSMQR